MPHKPLERLQSRLSSFDPPTRLVIAIAAKIATIHLSSGRYSTEFSLEDEDVKGEKESRNSLQKEQARIRSLQSKTVQEATAWLELVCHHLKIELNTLPDDPVADLWISKAITQEQHFDIAFELVLLSIGLAAPPVPPKPKSSFSLSASSSTSTPAPAPGLLEYTSSARTLVVRSAAYMGIGIREVEGAEKTIAQSLYFQLQETEDAVKGKGKEKDGNQESEWDEVADVRKKAASRGKALKWAATAGGFVLGGVAIGLTGGLAAPALVPLLAGTLGISFFGTAGGAILIGTLLGVGGGGLAGYRAHARLKGLNELSFEPIRPEDVPVIPSLVSTIVASGFLLSTDDSVEPWRAHFQKSGLDVFAMKADTSTFLDAGNSLENWVRNKIVTMGGTELLKMTALSALYAGVALPLTVFGGLSTALDSSFSRCRDKAKKAGLLLAEILEKRIQGKRPCILVGYGPGATMIYECLLELHRRELGGLVFSAYLISLPNSPSSANWAAVRSVVAHRLVNCYSTNDWLLAINVRLYSLSARVAGISPVKQPGVENCDVSDLVGGHLELRGVMSSILERIEVEKDLPGAWVGVEHEEEMYEAARRNGANDIEENMGDIN